MQRLAGVFLQVGAHQAHRLLLVAQVERHLAALHHRDLVLADLVALGQVGVEVVLAREDAPGRDGAAQGQAQLDGAGHGLAVHHGQGAGQGQVHGAGLGVGLGAKGGGRAAENFALGCELGVCLKADDDFVAMDKYLLCHI